MQRFDYLYSPTLVEQHGYPTFPGHDIESTISIEVRDTDLQPRANMAFLDRKTVKLIFFGIPPIGRGRAFLRLRDPPNVLGLAFR